MKTREISTTIATATIMLMGWLGIHTAAQETPKREMRGIWISTVSNIDWPSKPGLTNKQLQTETDRILDHLQSMGFNAVFFQVRPASDAFYSSSHEPWSVYLSGEQGTAPDKGFDPLQYWIAQAHRRGMELHAWINPFRATTNAQKGSSPKHITQTHPQWIIHFNKKGYIDPGIPSARRHIQEIIREIVREYDIDGIHLDDYFYPYPVGKETFFDTLSFKMHNPEGLPLSDWRRQNINNFIEGVQKTVKETKPWVVFGVSPFGVWRNARDDARGSQTSAGTTSYDMLHADVLAWMNNKWIDYVIPQIYWESSHPSANFNILAEWWSRQKGCSTYIGHALYKVNNGTAAWNDKNEMPNQLQKARKTKNIGGSVLFSYQQFKRDLLGLDSFLIHHHYKNKALVPSLLQKKSPSIKVEKIRKKKHTLQWQTNNDNLVRFYIVYRHSAKEKFSTKDGSHIHLITNQRRISLDPEEGGKFQYMVAPVDLYKKEHEPSKKIKVKY